MLKVRTLFSGIGAPESALKNLGVEFELVDFCEIDIDAIISYGAMHVDQCEHFIYPSIPEMRKWLMDRNIGWDFEKKKSRIPKLTESKLKQVFKVSVLGKNLGDVSLQHDTDMPYADMLVWGFPCTDISVAGKQKGIVEGETRSGMYYEGFRILKNSMPKYSIIENVKNLTGKQFKEQFAQMLEDIEALGYNNYWQVLNAKNYGIPQNRERVFIVSIRKDVDNGFEFPQGFDNGLRLKDMLEDEVDEKFYISNEKVEKIINSNFAQEKAMIQNSGICGTLLARDYKDPKCVAVKEATKLGYAIAEEGDSINIAFPNSDTRRGRVQKECACTLETSCNQAVLRPVRTEYGKAIRKDYEAGAVSESRHNMTQLEPRTDGITNTLTTVQKDNLLLDSYRIRKLTPKECFRLMGFSDEEYQRCVDAGVSNSQLYKQAGNSIVTKVLEAMSKVLLAEEMKAKLKVI